MTQGLMSQRKQLQTSLVNVNCLFRLKVDLEILLAPGTTGKSHVHTHTHTHFKASSYVMLAVSVSTQLQKQN